MRLHIVIGLFDQARSPIFVNLRFWDIHVANLPLLFLEGEFSGLSGIR
ncbi:MAG TPA: hypothetical protein V6C64_03960 [Microcoleaceae cyanobacterium]